MFSFKKSLVDPPAFGMLMLVLLAEAACGGDSNTTFQGGSTPYDPMFSLNSTFQGPHGGDPIALAVVRSTDQVIVA